MSDTERSKRAEAALSAENDSETREVLDEEAGEVERQAQQAESAFERAKEKRANQVR